MRVTSTTIRDGLVPTQTLRDLVRPHGRICTMDLDRNTGTIVAAALSRLLRPVPGTPADALHRAIDGMVVLYPLHTASGARLASVERVMLPAGRTNNAHCARQCMTLTYDDGVQVTPWVDYGDHAFSLLVAADGTPAFYAVLTSDGHHDCYRAASDEGLTYTLVDRLNEINDAHLVDLAGDVDPARLAALPRQSVPVSAEIVAQAEPEPDPEPVAEKPHEHMTLQQLYAAPPSPVGRARLGRR